MILNLVVSITLNSNRSQTENNNMCRGLKNNHIAVNVYITHSIQNYSNVQIQTSLKLQSSKEVSCSSHVENMATKLLAYD